LARDAAVSGPLLSHHLNVLKAAGLITGARRGRWIDYTLDDAAVESLIATLAPRASVHDRVGRAS
jgi:ArsR family transcriptional regulator